MQKCFGNYIDGGWRLMSEDDADGVLTRQNPSRRSETVFRAPWATGAVDDAVRAAHRAKPSWDRLGVEGRMRFVQQFAEVLREREDDLAAIIAREVGKPLWEARGEARALVSKINIMSTEGMELTQTDNLPDLSARTVHRPLGVLAVLGPFNFPMHLPNGHIIPGLLNGNTIVVKPSEMAGACMQLYMECADEADFPAGVINMVQGPGPVGADLVGHTQVNGVLFTGSYETGRRIKEATLDHPHKLLALEMGGKNTSIVLDDANLDQAAHEIAQAAFLTCGQRCTATSRVVARTEIVDELIDRVRAIAERVTTGDALEEDVFMGPIINEQALERFLAAQKDDEGGNLSAIVKGGRAREDLDGHFLSPGLWRAEEVDATGSHQASEIFGPDIVFYEVADDTIAANVANATEYGLAMSVFTEDRGRYEEMAYDLETGILNLNRSTAGASSRLPFGGVKRSGNHRPAALWAGRYCTYPQAQLHEEAAFQTEDAAEGPLAYLKQE